MTDGRCLAIDPGPSQSALVEFDEWAPRFLLMDDNLLILKCLRERPGRTLPLVIEKVQNYGRAVGEDTFLTCFWCGRFAEGYGGCDWTVGRPRVCTHLCGTPNAKKPQVRQALIDRFGHGQGRDVAIGTKAERGPLYGVKTHLWDALALAVTWCEMKHQRKFLDQGG